MTDTEQQTPPPEEGVVTTEGGGESEQGGFSEAFAERATPAKTEDLPETKADAQAPAAQEPPADAGGAEAPSKEAAESVAEPKAKPAFDPYAGLTPEQKAHFERLAASERSNRGRVGALTKKLNGVTGTQSPPAKTESSRTEDVEGAGGSKPAGKETTATDREARLKAATEEYGDIVGPLVEELEEVRKDVAKLTASTTRHEVEADAAAQTEAYAELEKAHPDFRDYNETNVKFVEWFKEQPAGVQALANSFDPAEVSLALKLFKAESAVSSAVTKEEGEGAGSTATGDKRERQLDGLKQASDRGAPAAAGVPKDFGSAFKHRAAQRV